MRSPMVRYPGESLITMTARDCWITTKLEYFVHITLDADGNAKSDRATVKSRRIIVSHWWNPASKLTHDKAGEVAQQVVQDDHGKDQQAAGHDLGGVCGHNSADDEHDGGGGDQRQHRTAFWVKAWKKWLTTKPSAMGTSTTLTMDRNIFTGFTSTRWPAYSRVSSGVRKGASTVETAVMPTDSATSPLER